MRVKEVVGRLPPGPQPGDTRLLWYDLSWHEPAKGIQRRQLKADKLVFGAASEPDWHDQMFMHPDEIARSIYTDWNLSIHKWELDTEQARVLTATGDTQYGLPNSYVEIRSFHLVTFDDGTIKMLRTVFPRCKMMYGHQTWHYVKGEGPKLVHELTLRTVRTTVRIDGSPLQKVPDEGTVWYKDLMDWRPRARIYEQPKPKEVHAMGYDWCSVDPLVRVSDGETTKLFHLRIDVVRAEHPHEAPSTLAIFHNKQETVEISGHIAPAMWHVILTAQADDNTDPGVLEFQLEWAEHRAGQQAHFTMFEVGRDNKDERLIEVASLGADGADDAGKFVWASAVWK